MSFGRKRREDESPVEKIEPERGGGPHTLDRVGGLCNTHRVIAFEDDEDGGTPAAIIDQKALAPSLRSDRGRK